MRRFLPALVLLASAPAALPGQSSPLLTPDRLAAIPHPHDLRISPDGRLAAFTVSTAAEGGTEVRSSIWLADLGSGEAWEATRGDGNAWAPRWRPEDGMLTFLSTRAGEGVGLWGMADRATAPSLLVRPGQPLVDYEWLGRSPMIIGVGEVEIPDPAPTTGRPARDSLGWRIGRRRHLFAVPLQGPSRDITPGARDVPSLEAALPGFATTSLGTEIALALPGPDGGATDVVTIAPDGSALQPLTTTAGPEARPTYSPDSRFLAYLSSEREGLGPTAWSLVIYERAAGRRFNPTGAWDRGIEAYSWHPGSQQIVIEALDEGARALFLADLSSGRVHPLGITGDNREARLTGQGDRVAFFRSTVAQPPELYTARTDGSELTQVTRFGQAALGGASLPGAASERLPGALRDSVQAWVVTPGTPGPHPAIVLVHDGLGQAWTDRWDPMFNAALLATHGYVVVMPNVRGSAGFGMAWESGAWRQPAGLPAEDLASVVSAVAARPDVDPARIGLLGSGMGGGIGLLRAAQELPVRSIAAHAPVVNPVGDAGTAMGSGTMSWGGEVTDPGARAAMEKASAINYASQWRTPTLLLHGTSDDTVDVSQSMQAIAVLRANRVPHGLVVLEGEGHRLRAPDARRRWQQAVLGWFSRTLMN